MLKDKTRILCTHHQTYLQQADHVLLLDDGEVVAEGLPSKVLQGVELIDIGDVSEKIPDKKPQRDVVGSGNGKLVEEEEKRVGNVSFEVYKWYMKCCGTAIMVVTVAALVVGQACLNVSDWWLSHWVNGMVVANTSGTDNRLTESTGYFSAGIPEGYAYYFSIYGYLALGYLLCRTVDTVVFVAFGTTRAATKLHDFLLEAVMKTPISFFDVHPVGRILNRFSSDMNEIDTEVGFFSHMFMEASTLLSGQVVLICISLPWFTLFLVPLGMLYFWVQHRYRKSSRELKRIGSVSRSPIYEHFTETLSGCMTIRAFREADRFINTNQHILDRSQHAEYNQNVAAIWLGLRLNMIGVLSVTAVAALAVLEHHLGSTNAGLVGLAITYSIDITPILSWLLNVFTELEKEMVHVERVGQYVNEAPREATNESSNVPHDWPCVGSIEFEDVFLRYREDLPYALQGVSFQVKCGEKLGICGRTGSGKSTLLKVLFNIVDVTGGSVVVDGVNIVDVGNSLLRSKMSIIPQDPFLFDESVSKNLDPTGTFPTHELMAVIGKCHLDTAVDHLGGLDGMVGEKGTNLSAGQRQLLCLARALLRKSQIICIDEATANVDLETDLLIQQTIREEFGSSTVITIAHRMNTIMDSDRVLVMEAGSVKEVGTPRQLLADNTSQFFALVNENRSSTNK